jgi:hypothetical protein
LSFVIRCLVFCRPSCRRTNKTHSQCRPSGPPKTNWKNSRLSTKKGVDKRGKRTSSLSKSARRCWVNSSVPRDVLVRPNNGGLASGSRTSAQPRGTQEVGSSYLALRPIKHKPSENVLYVQLCYSTTIDSKTGEEQDVYDRDFIDIQGQDEVGGLCNWRDICDNNGAQPQSSHFPKVRMGCWSGAPRLSLTHYA